MGCGVGLREEEGCLLVSGRDWGRVLSRSHMSGTMTIAAILPGLGEEQQEKGGREMARILLKPLSPKVSAWAREVVVVVRTRGPGRFIQSSVILPPPLDTGWLSGSFAVGRIGLEHSTSSVYNFSVWAFKNVSQM